MRVSIAPRPTVPIDYPEQIAGDRAVTHLSYISFSSHSSCPSIAHVMIHWQESANLIVERTPVSPRW